MAFLYFTCSILLVVSAISEVKSVYNTNATELFYIKLEPKMFWPHIADLIEFQGPKAKLSSLTNLRNLDHPLDVEYEASLKSMPDLPNWISQRHLESTPHAYLYGTAPKPGITQIEIVALNRRNYKTLNKTITLKTADKTRKARFEVQLKFFDINVEDMLMENWHTDLVKIFQRKLWNPHFQGGSDEDVYLTLLTSSIDMGYRLPHNPKEKEGVIVHIGSVHPFSKDLLKIEKEVQPLLTHSPCPKDFRKTSGHRYFSHRSHFKVDWCEFRLYSDIEESHMGSRLHSVKTPPPVPIYKEENDYFQPPAAKSHTRDLLLDFILCIVIPAAVIIMLLIGLTLVMFCNREGVDERNKLITNVELTQFNSIQQASNKLREMAINREQPMLALPAPSSTSSIHGNSLPRSQSECNSPKLPIPAIKLNAPKLGAGVRRPSSLRPGPLYAGSIGPGSRRNSVMTH